MNYLAQVTFFLNGLPQNEKHENVTAFSPNEAKEKVIEKYAGYGAEFGEINIEIYTEQEIEDIKNEHILGDNPEGEYETIQ